MHKSQMSIYSSNLKGLLNKLLNKDKLNGICRVCMKVRFSWLNSSVRTKSVEWNPFIHQNWKACYTSALQYATVLSRCKACLPGDMKAWTSDEHDFISYEKHIIDHIAGEVNVGKGEEGEK